MNDDSFYLNYIIDENKCAIWTKDSIFIPRIQWKLWTTWKWWNLLFRQFHYLIHQIDMNHKSSSICWVSGVLLFTEVCNLKRLVSDIILPISANTKPITIIGYSSKENCVCVCVCFALIKKKKKKKIDPFIFSLCHFLNLKKKSIFEQGDGDPFFLFFSSTKVQTEEIKNYWNCCDTMNWSLKWPMKMMMMQRSEVWNFIWIKTFRRLWKICDSSTTISHDWFQFAWKNGFWTSLWKHWWKAETFQHSFLFINRKERN